MSIEHITDHAARGVARLIDRYRKPRNSALLASWLSEVQALEDALWQLLTERAVANATGVTLDKLGKIVGQPREGRDDDSYRVWIAARAVVTKSSGKRADLVAIAKKLVGEAIRVRLEDYPPASAILRIEDGIDSDTGNQMAQIFARAKALGVSLHFTWFSDAGAAFRFAPGSTVVSSSPSGFSSGAFAAVSDGFVLAEFAAPPEPIDLLLDGEQLMLGDDPLTF